MTIYRTVPNNSYWKHDPLPNRALLKSLADTYFVRTLIRAKSNQILGLEWTINADSDKKANEVADLLKYPNIGTTYREYLESLLYDICVFGACASKHNDNKGIYSIDSSTIAYNRNPLGFIDEDLPYSQVINLAVNPLKASELTYTQESYDRRSYVMLCVELVTQNEHMFERQLAMAKYSHILKNMVIMPQPLSNETKMTEWAGILRQIIQRLDTPIMPMPYGTEIVTVDDIGKISEGVDYLNWLRNEMIAIFGLQASEIYTLEAYKSVADSQIDLSFLRSVQPMIRLVKEHFQDIFKALGYEDVTIDFPQIDAFLKGQGLSDDEPSEGVNEDDIDDDIPSEVDEDEVDTTTDTERMATPAVVLETNRGGEVVLDIPLYDDIPKLQKFENGLYRTILNIFNSLDISPYVEQFAMNQTKENAAKIAEAFAKYFGEEMLAIEGDIYKILDLGIDTVAEVLEETTGIALDWALINADAMQFATTYTFKLVTGGDDIMINKGIEETTRAIIQKELINFIDSGESIEQLVDRLKEKGFSKARAEMIAQTEATRAFSRGNFLNYEYIQDELGGEVSVIWITANDEIVARCPICYPLHGRVRKMGKEFAKGITQSPAHPRCRCGHKARINF